LVARPERRQYPPSDDWAKNLQITRELEPRREMKVVEQLDLMLDSKATERDGSSPLLPSLRDIAS